MPFLLDVNVLIALLYDRHEFHDRASAWFSNVGRHDWLSCPITENGAIRILGGPKFPDRLELPEIARQLRSLMKLTNHHFLPDDASIVDDTLVNFTLLNSSKRLTDVYLVALAARRNVVLATLDERLDSSAVKDGADHVLLIPRQQASNEASRSG